MTNSKKKKKVRCHTCGREIMPPVFRDRVYHEDGGKYYRIFLCRDCDAKIDWK